MESLSLFQIFSKLKAPNLIEIFAVDWTKWGCSTFLAWKALLFVLLSLAQHNTPVYLYIYIIAFLIS